MFARGLAATVLCWVSGLAPAAPGAPTAHWDLLCEAVYLPARSTWVRTVRIAFDDQRVSSVAVDGLQAYTFAVRGNIILTALDNERIELDLENQTWTSDFRGLATAQGRCERRD